ncbi:hypothetical protein, partial [Nocardia brasiliensis]|uniref:hypothetical protein n=1 Tax=Nocardia brasiliensis TaxID=37326 RepID=UPI00245590A7
MVYIYVAEDPLGVRYVEETRFSFKAGVKYMGFDWDLVADVVVVGFGAAGAAAAAGAGAGGGQVGGRGRFAGGGAGGLCGGIKYGGGGR